MSRLTSIVFSTGLIGLGALAWSHAGRPLVADKELDVPLNPLGIKRSPYGEVFAMAMQGPIDNTFNGLATGAGGHTGGCSSCGGEHAVHPDGKRAGFSVNNLIATLETGVTERTNPKPATPAHKFFLRRQTEDKLRFAYDLDPAHYGNFVSLYFFLTQPKLGTRPELTPSAAKLAEDTIRYCLSRTDDPRPALTAAAATSNLLEMMFNERQVYQSDKFSIEQMRQHLNLLDYCLHRYVTTARQWDESGNWDLLSPMRIQECDQRFQFITRFRQDAEGTISRFAGDTENSQATAH